MDIFTRLRTQSFRRTGDGWIGGICSGLGHRWGIAPILIRLLALGLVIFGGIVVIAYSLAWLVIPRDDDDQVVLEDVVDGHVTGTFAGALALLIIGVWGTFVTFEFVTGIVLKSFVGLAVIILGLVAILVAVLRAQHRRTRRDPGDHSQPDQASAGTDRTLVLNPSEERDTPPAPQRPRRPASPAVSGRYILITLALALGAAAIVLLATGTTFGGYLVSLGTITAVIGFAVVYAGVTGKRGVWLTFLSWILILPVAGATLVATGIPTTVLTEKNAPLVAGHDPSVRVSGIDIRQLSASEIPDGTVISSAVTDMDINVNAGQSVVITVHGTGDVQLVDFGDWEISSDRNSQVTPTPLIVDENHNPVPADEPLDLATSQTTYSNYYSANQAWSGGIQQTTTISSPAAVKDPDTARHITIDYGFGSVTIVEEPPSGMDPVEYVAAKLGYTINDNTESKEK